jgi:hypothetical protein
MILRLLTLLAILTSCTADRQLTLEEKEFVGIWQVMPDVASGWADAYRFFDNGQFIFHYNQMVCDNRTLSYSGTWELTKDKNLKLTIDKKTTLEGGKLVPSMGSCGSDLEIEGGEVKDVKLKDIEIKMIRLSRISVDNNHGDLKTVTFDNRPLWKLEADPTRY